MNTNLINHPQKGSMITVEPIRDLKAIEKIKKYLQDKPLYFCIFIVGINTNLRASDLVRITAGQVKGLDTMGELLLKEQKTGKARRINLNAACVLAIRALLKSREYKDDDVLFTGQRGAFQPGTIHKLVKSWCKAVGLKGNFGAHTLRKTFGYHQYHTFGESLTTIQFAFNHSSERETFRYIGIQPQELQTLYKNQI